jgi:Xaa-Pro aminopeptidase
MSDLPDQRAPQAAAKLALARRWLHDAGAGALRLRGIDWFAWSTAGGDSAVLQTLETGVAEVLVTKADACILTDETAADRLRDEQVPPGFSFHVTPWEDPEWRERFVLESAAGAPVLSDRPRGAELPLPPLFHHQRLVLSKPEQQRYRELGAQAAEAMSEALRAARPDWTEYALAAAAARALWQRGIQPALALAVGSRRLALYREPTPSNAELGERAMLVLRGRRHGLYASLTRFVSFGRCDPTSSPLQADLMTVEATALAACVPGNSLAAVYHALVHAYRHASQPDAMREQPQGGVTGYLAHELVATASTALALEPGMAFALRPGFAGIQIEDTFLLAEHGLENLTFDPAWPAATVQGRLRPLWLEAAC